ncbi:MAG TPA: response regulator [Gallionella sp.]|nr:response regulator [Gallionella sp.]
MDTIPPSAKILIVTDIASDAEMVKSMLDADFGQVFISSDPHRAVEDFERRRPDLLLLAFNGLEKSEQYYLGLYHQSHGIHLHPPRSVVLCHKAEMERAYELCMKGFFNDCIPFWPMTFDVPHLNMSLHDALRDLPARTRQAKQPEAALNHHQERSDQGSAASHPAEEGQEPDAADGLIRELIPGKREHARQYFSATEKSTESAKRWLRDFKKVHARLREPARISNGAVMRERPMVMVVDDDEFQRQLIERLLQAERYRLVFASDGIEALNILRKLRPDLILMDFMMPDMDGMETTQRLKANPRFAGIPVIMVTGKSEGKVVMDSLKAGAVDFVVKPIDRATLISKIHRVLGDTSE